MSEKRNIKMIVEYDGTDYHGWQRQANVRSIQQVMEDTVSKIVNRFLAPTAYSQI